MTIIYHGTACTKCTNGVKTWCTHMTDTECNKDPPKAKCDGGATWSASGVDNPPFEPCAACATCGPNGVKAECTASTKTQCTLPNCDPLEGRWSATGKAPCEKCKKESMCADGVSASCSPTSDTLCKSSPTAGTDSNSSSSSSSSSGQPGGGTSPQAKIDVATSARPTAVAFVCVLFTAVVF